MRVCKWDQLLEDAFERGSELRMRKTEKICMLTAMPSETVDDDYGRVVGAAFRRSGVASNVKAGGFLHDTIMSRDAPGDGMHEQLRPDLYIRVARLSCDR